MARLRRSVLVATPLVLAGLTLSSCGVGGAVADARTSCRFVAVALRLEHQSLEPTLTTRARTRLQDRALATLLRATPSAAAATSADGSWNALMTTVNEAERVPIAQLVPSLTRLCAIANSSTPYL